MPGDPRPWEQRHTPDQEVGWSEGLAITFAFLLVQMFALIIIGFDARGLVVGFVLGSIVIVLLSKLAVRSHGGVRRGPPPDLL